MKKQSKKMSVLESVANTVTVLLMSFYIQLLVFPLFGIMVTTATNLKITAIFFVASFARSYSFRRIFNKINNQ